MKYARIFLGIGTMISILMAIAIFFLTGVNKHNVSPLVSLGERYIGQENYEEAVLAFSRAIEIEPRTARALYGRARANIGLGNNEMSLADLVAVADIAPDKAEKINWMIDKINRGEGDDIILLPYREEVASDDEFKNIRFKSDDREIAVVLDRSGSMQGTPMEATKVASRGFVSKILQNYADVGIITFDDATDLVADFSMDEQYLIDRINTIEPGGGTDTAQGLQFAHECLKNSGARQKIIVLMSDGQAQSDPIPSAEEIKEDGITIYTLGFFSEISDKAYVQSVMEEIASEGCHYEVDSEQVLQGFFDDIASQINGQKYYYIRIACPVDVSVKCNGETLNSAKATTSKRTSFGSLTFEENDKSEESSDQSAYNSIEGFENNESGQQRVSDTRIKVLRLKSDNDYDIEIVGNGKGKMDYTIGFMDDDGEYTDLRRFKSIPISKKTVINTIAEDSATTVLNVDSDGDGKVDTKYKAGKNGRGKEVDDSFTIIIICSAVAGIILLILIIIIINKIKAKRRGE